LFIDKQTNSIQNSNPTKKINTNIQLKSYVTILLILSFISLLSCCNFKFCWVPQKNVLSFSLLLMTALVGVEFSSVSKKAAIGE